MKICQIYPELGEIQMDFSNFIILLGVVLGFLLSATGFSSRLIKNKFKSLVYFPISLILLEIFLNRTGYMYYVIGLLDFSEPVQFLIPPAIFLSIKATGSIDFKNWELHLLPFFVYLVFLIPVFLAPIEFKTKSYFYMHHATEDVYTIHGNLLLIVNRLRILQLPLFFIQSAIYLVLSIQVLLQYRKKRVIPVETFTWWFLFSVLFVILVLVVLLVKSFFLRDIGDHIIAWFLTVLLFLSTFRELIKSELKQSGEKKDVADKKKERAISFKIDDRRADEIRAKLNQLMVEKKIFTDNLISITRISKLISEPSYVISYVLNEKMGCSFFEWISYYRIEEAKRLLSDSSNRGITIEQIAEDTGYNSKSAFNKAFKKFTGITPSAFKNQPVI